jgi:hypothetical protein
MRLWSEQSTSTTDSGTGVRAATASSAPPSRCVGPAVLKQYRWRSHRFRPWGRLTRSLSGLAVLRRPASTSTTSPICQRRLFPVVGSGTNPLKARLWQLRHGRATGVPPATTPVGSECSCPSYVPTTSI